MLMDGAALYAVATELNPCLTDARIERIAQPDRYCIVMVVRSGGKNRRLLLSADPESARLHITQETAKGPEKPFQFLMTLRKYLLHGRIDSILVPHMDRAVHLLISSLNELGDRTQYRLILECMGKHSNLILTDETGSIIDAVRRVPPAVSSLRTVLPGGQYHVPPVQQKTDILTLNADAISSLLASMAGGSLAKALVDTFYGISPFTARELLKRIHSEDMRLPLADAALRQVSTRLHSFIQSIQDGRISPCSLRTNTEEPFGFFPFPLSDYQCTHTATFSEAIDLYYRSITQIRLLSKERTSLIAVLNTRLQKLFKRRGFQLEALIDASHADSFRKEGELILANIWQIQRGQTQFEAVDYENGGTVLIHLDTAYSPSENASQRFKKYRKLKSSVEAAKEQLRQIEPEIDYLQSVLVTVAQSESMENLSDIRIELQNQRILQAPQQHGKREQNTAQPLHFLSSEGIDLFIGRNNTQNDFVTTKLSRPGDTWLHVQGMPGSHVIVRANPVPAKTLQEAAMVAAFFSGARNSSNVPVDYTLIKFVRKPSKAKPGFVTYSSQRTIFVTPEDALVKSLMRNE